MSERPRIHIPRRPSSEASKAFRRALRSTASECGWTEEAMEFLVVVLLTEVVDAVARGETVQIPNFGIFGSRMYRMPNSLVKRAIPTFAPARALRKELAVRLVHTNTTDKVFKRMRQRNRTGSRPRLSYQTTTASLHKARQRILARNEQRVPEIG